MAYAANSGGKFGEMLNRILTGNPAGVSGRTWENDTTGTVYNAENFAGMSSGSFVKLSAHPNDLKCNTNQCMYGVDSY
jgi:hypothetical protein